MKLFKKEWWWIGLFFAVVAIFFSPIILQRKIPVPSDALVGLYYPWRDLFREQYPRGIPFKNFLITDPVRQQIPWRKIAIDQWLQWRLPRWNPFNFSGTPINANIQAAAFYPINIVFFIFNFPVAWTIIIVIQPLLAGLFLYVYLRHLKLSPWSSTMAAVVWSFGGFSTAWLTWGTMVQVALWLPLILLSLDEIIASPRFGFRWGILLLFSLTMSFFAGHLQIFFYTFLLSIGYGLWKIAAIPRPQQKEVMVHFFWIVGLFVVLTAIQWIPLIRSLLESSRFSGPTNWREAGWFLPWQNLVQFIAPDFFGNPTTLNYWGVWNYGEFVGYIGIIGLVFALLAIARSDSRVRFWTAVLFLSFVFLLPNPISKIIYEFRLPVVSAMQPTRLTMIVDFALSVLVGFGADYFTKQAKALVRILGAIAIVIASLWFTAFILSRGSNQELVSQLLVAKNNLLLPTALFAASVLLFILWKKVAAFKKYTIILQIAGLILLSFDLLRFSWKFTPFSPREYFFPQTKALKFLESQPKPFRIAVLDSRIVPPNVSAYYGLESIEGYDPIYAGSYEQFIAASERGKADVTPPYGFNRIITPHNIDSPLLPLLNVRFVLSLEDLKKPYLIKVFQEGETRVYEDARSTPRAYFVERVSFERDKRTILNNLFDTSFQPQTRAFVERPVTLLPIPVQSSEFAEIRSYNNSEILLDENAMSPRFLFIANMFDDGWRAEIDGRQTTIYRTNYLFQGIVVPAGRHSIILRYRG